VRVQDAAYRTREKEVAYLLPHSSYGAMALSLGPNIQAPPEGSLHVLIQTQTRSASGDSGGHVQLPGSGSRHSRAPGTQEPQDRRWETGHAEQPEYSKECLVVKGEREVPACYVASLTLRLVGQTGTAPPPGAPDALRRALSQESDSLEGEM